MPMTDAKSSNPHASILALTGMANYSPGPAVDNATLENALQGPVCRLMEYFRIKTRHYVIDPQSGAAIEPGLGTTEMSVRAGRQALARAGLAPDAIDTLICATSTPDDRLPPLPHAVQRELGLPSVQTFDLRGGCAVAMQALSLAGALIESGRSRRVLITLADTLSRYFLKPLIGQSNPRTEALVNATTFSDGAAAVVVEAARENDGALRLLNVAAQSSHADQSLGFAVNGAGDTLHNHRAIRENLPPVMAAALQVLRASNRVAGERQIDHLIVPQVNPSMLDMVKSELHDRIYYIGDRIGNCPAPAVLRAMALGVEEGVFKPGCANVGVIGVETASWTFGTALVR